jgi:hypothetical protein
MRLDLFIFILDIFLTFFFLFFLHAHSRESGMSMKGSYLSRFTKFRGDLKQERDEKDERGSSARSKGWDEVHHKVYSSDPSPSIQKTSTKKIQKKRPKRRKLSSRASESFRNTAESREEIVESEREVHLHKSVDDSHLTESFDDDFGDSMSSQAHGWVRRDSIKAIHVHDEVQKRSMVDYLLGKQRKVMDDHIDDTDDQKKSPEEDDDWKRDSGEKKGVKRKAKTRKKEPVGEDMRQLSVIEHDLKEYQRGVKSGHASLTISERSGVDAEGEKAATTEFQKDKKTKVFRKCKGVITSNKRINLRGKSGRFGGHGGRSSKRFQARGGGTQTYRFDRMSSTQHSQSKKGDPASDVGVDDGRIEVFGNAEEELPVNVTLIRENAVALKAFFGGDLWSHVEVEGGRPLVDVLEEYRNLFFQSGTESEDDGDAMHTNGRWMDEEKWFDRSLDAIFDSLVNDNQREQRPEDNVLHEENDHSEDGDRLNLFDWQRDVLHMVGERKSSLCIVPTGNGKSLIYQIASVLVPSPVIVVSPLTALMLDQMRNMPSCLSACIITGGMSKEEQDRAYESVLGGHCRIIFVSPERFMIQSFKKFLREFQSVHKHCLVCIDEAHCVSEWSHNFRPSFLRFRGVLDECIPNHWIVGLTGLFLYILHQDDISFFRVACW